MFSRVLLAVIDNKSILSSLTTFSFSLSLQVNIFLSYATMVAGTLLYTPHKIHTLVRVPCRLVLKEVLALMGSQESSSLSLVA